MMSASLSVIIEDGDYAMTIIMDDGNFNYKLGISEDSDVVLRMSGEVLKKLLAGQIEPSAAYLTGVIKAAGDITKFMVFRSLIEIFEEEFGIKFYKF